jgi:hypothetical protein
MLLLISFFSLADEDVDVARGLVATGDILTQLAADRGRTRERGW